MRKSMAIAALVLVLVASACSGGAAHAGKDIRPDLYACEGCEAVYERQVESLTWHAAVAGTEEPGERLVATGTVYGADGKSPQAGVVIYLHQTNAEGLYAGGNAASEWSRRHGRLRAWVRTGSDGRYRFDTIKPAPYPDMTGPAHLHLTVLEPGKRPYYIDDIVFDGEFMVDERYRAGQELRGGSGIVTLSRDEGGTLLAQRDIVLERHPD